jgi:hypothetical protein
MDVEEKVVKLTHGQQESVSIIEKSTVATNELKSLLLNSQANLTFLNEIDKVEIVETANPVMIAQSSNILKEVASLSQISTKSSETVCRICHVEDSNQNEDLIVACKCKGSLKFVHESCLLKWLSYNRKILEIIIFLYFLN